MPTEFAGYKELRTVGSSTEKCPAFATEFSGSQELRIVGSSDGKCPVFARVICTEFAGRGDIELAPWGPPRSMSSTNKEIDAIVAGYQNN
jgi:hypothetical protein